MVYNPDTIADQFPILHTSAASGAMHYLDNAAMAQMPEYVLDAISNHDRLAHANVKRGIHFLAEAATEAYERARSQAAAYLGIGDRSDEVIFTSGATAGINIVAHCMGRQLKKGDEIVLSMLEHHSNIVPWLMLQQEKGVVIRYLPLTANGAIDVRRAEEIITANTKIVSVSHGSNVTGAVTHLAPIIALAHTMGARVLVDGAQVAPQGPLDIPGLDADFYVFSGHKTYGPSGIGILWGKMDLLEEMQPLFGGGEMIAHVSLTEAVYQPPPHRFEAGTPPITQAVGLGAALDWISRQDLPALHHHLSTLIQRLMEGLKQIDCNSDRITIVGPETARPRLPLVSFAIADLHPHDICQVLSDRHGVALRGGHHCAQPLHTHLGLDATTRASLAAFNRGNDIDAFLNGMEDCMTLLG